MHVSGGRQTTPSALLSGKPNKLHHLWFFRTHGLSHFVNSSIRFHILSHFICLTGWRAKQTARCCRILPDIQALTFRQRFAWSPDYEPLRLPYWMESQINCTTYDSFVHMGCHILSPICLVSRLWATPSALLDGKPNKLHHLWFFCTHGLSHFVNSSIRFHILSHFIFLTGWRAK
jgi:hypothetical protein